MGGESVPPASETTAEMLGSLMQYLPGALQVANMMVAPTAQAQLAADQAVSPGYAQMQTELAEKYLPRLASVGRDLSAAEQARAAESELDIARGPGRELVQVGNELQRTLDPEFFKARGEIGDAISTLLGGMNPNALSDAEAEEIQRAIGRSGTPNPESAWDTTRNAMTFGSKLQEKQSRFGDTISRLSTALPSLKQGYSGFEMGTRRALTPNTGVQQFTGAQQGAGGANTFGTFNNAMNSATSIANQTLAKKKDFWDTLGITGGFVNNILSGVGGIIPG